MSAQPSPTPGSDGTATQPKSFVSKIKSQNAPIIGSVLTMPSVSIAQLTAQTSADFVMIDMEHAPLPMETVTQMVHAYVQTSKGTKFPLVRIPSHGVEWVKWALDSGAAGIIIPMVSNAAEMAAIIDRAIYPPGGRRSFGPFYAPFAHPEGAGEPGSGVGRYVARAQRGEIAILPMIESKEGLENAEEILGTEGVSGAFVGPADLRFSLGMPPALDGSEEVFTNAMKRIAEVAKKLGKVVGTMGISEGVAKKRANDGYDFLLSSFDQGAMMAGMAQDLSVVQKAVAKL